MTELDLSLMIQSGEHLREFEMLLAEFEAKSRIHVRVMPLAWPTGWSEMVRAAIYSKGPQVSEVGTSWVADLVGMDALQPLSKAVISSFGGQEGYFPQSWQSCFIVGEPQMWAAPWLAGARVLYYRRDWLEQAGIDPATAFTTPAAMHATLARLQADGVAHPWAVTTQPSLNTLHVICSWVWGAGGDLVSANGKTLLFANPATLDGMAAYFSLGQFLGSGAAELSDASATSLFWDGNAAVTMDGSWILPAQRRTGNPAVVENVGVALPPGPPFIGGSNLVVWKSVLRQDPALELLRFLTSPEVERAAHHATGLLPARRDQIQSPEVASDFTEIFDRALMTGRSWPNLTFGGLLEEKLTRALGDIWQDVLAAPERDVRDILREHLAPVERRIRASLSL